MSRCPYCGLKYCERIDHKNQRIAELEEMMSSYPSEEGIVEYFEGLVEYMRKLGYEDPRDKRIEELEEQRNIWCEDCKKAWAQRDGAIARYETAEARLKALGGDDVN